MKEFSNLLGQAISSIIEVKEESDLDSFLSGENVSFLNNEIKGLDDFELVCFLVVKQGLIKLLKSLIPMECILNIILWIAKKKKQLIAFILMKKEYVETKIATNIYLNALLQLRVL